MFMVSKRRKRVSKKEKENLIQSEIESKEEFVHQMSLGDLPPPRFRACSHFRVIFNFL